MHYRYNSLREMEMRSYRLVMLERQQRAKALKMQPPPAPEPHVDACPCPTCSAQDDRPSFGG